MKKRLITLLTISLITANMAFAEYSYVDSGDFTGDAFFVPPVIQEQQQAGTNNQSSRSPSLPPLKKMRLKVKQKLNSRDTAKTEYAPTAPVEDIFNAGLETSEYASKELKDDFDMSPDGFEMDDEALAEQTKKHFWQKKSKVIKEDSVRQDSENIILDCENIDYDTENYCVIATNNVIVHFVNQASTLYADKIVYDRLNNTIRADGNVKIVRNGQTITGEYIFVDLNEENALIEQPVTQTASIEIKAQKGYVYGDRVVQENGSIKVDQEFPINFQTVTSGPIMSRMMTKKSEKSVEDIENGRIKFKVKNIKISQKGDLEIIDLKKVSLFKGSKKICKLPPAKIYTNKNFDFADTQSWEAGSFRGLGMYIGPGHIFEIPGGSILKVMPILNYKSGFGFGGIARFENASNWTQASYGTAASKFMIRGTQKLDDGLKLEYVMNDYMREWFLGRRRAKYGAALVYQKGYTKQDFLLKGQASTFAHRFDFGYYQDIDQDKSYKDTDGSGLGTTRTRYMMQASQNLLSYRDEDKQKEFTLMASAQLAASLYGTGDTQVIGRIGPSLHTQYKWWMQDIGYYQSAYSDNSPIPVFDAYRYGESNFYLREYIRICKYLTLSWFGSFNLSNDSPNHRQLQENTFYITFGPEDIKFSIGYDAERETTRFLVEIMMDAKGTQVDYDRLEIKQDKKAQKKNEIKEESASDFVRAETKTVLQHAVVEDVKIMEDVL